LPDEHFPTHHYQNHQLFLDKFPWYSIKIPNFLYHLQPPVSQFSSTYLPQTSNIPSLPLFNQRSTSKEHRSQFEPLRLSQVSIVNSAAKNHAFVAYSLLIPRVDVEEEEKSMSKQKQQRRTRGFCIYLQFNVAGFWLFHAALFSTLV
jgi:hypothetical protein